MSFIEMLITALFCLGMFALIFTNLFLDEEEYKSLKMKSYKLYTFKDGTQFISTHNINSEEIKKQIEKHGEIIDLQTDEGSNDE